MGLLDQLTGVVEKYAGANPNQPPPNVESDFDQVANTSSPEALAQGLSHAFRSDQTPSFGQMASQLFSRGNPEQRAGLLNTLLGSVGASGLGSLAGGGGTLSNLIRAFQSGPVTPSHADQVSPQTVNQIADHAEKQNPSVIDEVSRFASQHPGLVKTLGATALTIALSRLARR